ncbi:MAG TPA: hypothetical protein VF210_02525 [Pseudomonadales bacterium]
MQRKGRLDYIPLRIVRAFGWGIADNARLSHRGNNPVHTHLKGRIFSSEGTSYLVLTEPGERPESLRVKALNAQRTVQEMPIAEIERHLAEQRRPVAG